MFKSAEDKFEAFTGVKTTNAFTDIGGVVTIVGSFYVRVRKKQDIFPDPCFINELNELYDDQLVETFVVRQHFPDGKTKYF